MGLIFSLFLIGIILALSCMDLARINSEMVAQAAPAAKRPVNMPAAPQREAPALIAEPIATVAAPTPANDEPTLMTADDGAEVKKSRSKRRSPAPSENPPIAD